MANNHTLLMIYFSISYLNVYRIRNREWRVGNMFVLRFI